MTGEGLSDLKTRIELRARELLPREDVVALNRRQAVQLDEANSALARAGEAVELVFVAEELRLARAAFDRFTGRNGVEEVLDALFSRFCLGK